MHDANAQYSMLESWDKDAEALANAHVVGGVAAFATRRDALRRAQRSGELSDKSAERELVHVVDPRQLLHEEEDLRTQAGERAVHFALLVKIARRDGRLLE